MFDTVDATLATVAGSPWVLLVVAVLAAADALVPLAPSESTLIAVAVASAASGRPPLVAVVVAAALGAYGGDRLAYGVGRWFGPAMTARLQRRRGTRAVAELAHRVMQRRGRTLIVFGRYLPGGRSATAITAGLVGYPLSRFRGFTALAVTIWALWGALLGYGSGALVDGHPTLGLALAYTVAAMVAVVAGLARRLSAARPTSTTRPVGCIAAGDRGAAGSPSRPGRARH
ncbi:DedA family protein [Micromonospora globispora]|uniref:DedA family protein n=1 Tax=Micromonospora globispora TaxID=1450148 RepID=UPI000F60417F|nr:VTT domain-containing protein [Micromonospora globispora]RQW93976.1 DedA protein [Micromonospora globispora]